MRLNFCNSAKGSNIPIKETKVIIELRGGINDTGITDGDDPMVSPHALDGRNFYVITPLPILILPVPSSPSLVDLVYLVQLSGLVIVKYAFGGGSLANIYMGHDTNVPVHARVDCPLFVQGTILLVCWKSENGENQVDILRDDNDVIG